MEEKAKQEKNQQPKKLSYEELSQAASDISMQYQKAVQHIRKLENALSEADFSRTSFLLQSLFRVMDHAELYDVEFVDWAKGNIQTAIKSFYEASIPAEEEKKDEA